MGRNNEDVGFAELQTQLRIISRLLAAQLKATTGQQEMVRILSTTGATNAEIADVLDTTSATVATTLQRLRKKAKEKEIVVSSDSRATYVEAEQGNGGN